MKIRFFDINDTDGFGSVYQRLMPCFGGYEPFDAPPAFAVYEADEPVALASVLIVPQDSAIPGLNDDSNLEAELTIFVHPKYRKCGVAKKLSRNVKAYMDEFFPKVPVVYTLPGELADSSFARHVAFTEMIMKITPDALSDILSKKMIEKRLSDKGIKIVTTKHNSDLSLKLKSAKAHMSDPSGNTGRNEEAFCRHDPGSSVHSYVAEVYFHRDANSACLYGLYVSPKYRGRGLGQLLTQYGLSFFLSDNIPVVLNVRDTNIPAINLYKKIGFTEADSCVFYKLTQKA